MARNRNFRTYDIHKNLMDQHYSTDLRSQLFKDEKIKLQNYYPGIRTIKIIQNRFLWLFTKIDFMYCLLLL